MVKKYAHLFLKKLASEVLSSTLRPYCLILIAVTAIASTPTRFQARSYDALNIVHFFQFLLLLTIFNVTCRITAQAKAHTPSLTHACRRMQGQKLRYKG